MQRPGVLETVSIDLYIIRTFGLFVRQFPQVRLDIVALLDEWATRFFEELDYVKEGNNGTLFAQQMAKDLPQVRTPLCTFSCTICCTCAAASVHACLHMKLNLARPRTVRLQLEIWAFLCRSRWQRRTVS